MVGDSFTFTPMKVLYICKMYKVSLDSKDEYERNAY